jgi:lipoprotein-anchoring transpeptidase ErfK/SrfK
MLAITCMGIVGSAAPSMAAVPAPEPAPGVASVLPADGAVVGVAHPVVVTFTAPVIDRGAAERSIHVTSPGNMAGHFEWPESNVVQWGSEPVLARPLPCLGGHTRTDDGF